MNILVSCVGRFHSFRLAEQLEKHGHLKAFFTQETKRWHDALPKKKIRGLMHLKIIKLFDIASLFLPFMQPLAKKFDSYRRKRHDRFVAQYIKDIDGIDMFVCWMGVSLESIKAAKKKKMPVVLVSGSTHPKFRKKILEEEYRKILRKETDFSVDAKQLKLLSLCDYLQVPSHFAAKTFIDEGFPKERIIVDGRGADLELFRKEKKHYNVFRIIFTGTVSIRKGSYYLMKAFYDLNLPDSELIFVGAIDQEMKPIIEKFRKDNIKFLGPKSQDKLYKYYSQSSVFVHPSIEEGLSNAQLEALSCGLPVICTTNTGGKDIIEEGKEGFVVPIRDVNALKDKIKYLYDNPDKLERMSKNAQKKAKKLTWVEYGRAIQNIYNNEVL